MNNTFNYWISPKAKFGVKIRETILAFEEAMGGKVPVLEITRDISGYTLASAGGCFGDDYESCKLWAKITISTYYTRVTPINNLSNELLHVDFTRDGWYSLGVKDKTKDLYTLFNRAFEPENTDDETL